MWFSKNRYGYNNQGIQRKLNIHCIYYNTILLRCFYEFCCNVKKKSIRLKILCYHEREVFGLSFNVRTCITHLLNKRKPIIKTQYKVFRIILG